MFFFPDGFQVQDMRDIAGERAIDYRTMGLRQRDDNGHVERSCVPSVEFGKS